MDEKKLSFQEVHQALNRGFNSLMAVGAAELVIWRADTPSPGSAAVAA